MLRREYVRCIYSCMPRAFSKTGVAANAVIGILLVLQTAKSALLARWSAPSPSLQKKFVDGMSIVSIGLNPLLALMLLRAPATTLPGALLVMGLIALLAIDAVGGYVYQSIANDPDLDAKVAAGLQAVYLYILASYGGLLLLRAVIYAVILVP